MPDDLLPHWFLFKNSEEIVGVEGWILAAALSGAPDPISLDDVQERLFDFAESGVGAPPLPPVTPLYISHAEVGVAGGVAALNDAGQVLDAAGDPVVSGGNARLFTFGVDAGWDFGEGWVDLFAPDGPPSTANRAVVTPDTITFYVSAIAAQTGVDQTGAYLSPTIVLPAEFFVDPLFAGGALDYFILLSDTTGQHRYFGQGVAFFETVDDDDDRWSIYMADAVDPEVLGDDATGETVTSADLFASVGTDGVIIDNIQVYLYGTVIRNLGAL